MFPVIYSDMFWQHETGGFHPEQPGRLGAIVDALRAAPWQAQLEWHPPTPIVARSPQAWIAPVHAAEYQRSLAALCRQGGGAVDADTIVSAQSYDVALLAVNAWLDGVDYAQAKGGPVFVLARPPGHHALPQTGMGFCLFSNAAIAATYALAQGAQRVAILDWDVHHGNGTQAIVAANPAIFYCSLHEFPHYPGTGKANERGDFENVLNIPLAAGSTIAKYCDQFESKVMPFLRRAQPDLLIVSAGYDANQADPLANMALQPEDYRVLTRYCLEITRSIVFGLEGGYDFGTLGQSVVATIGACLTVD